MPDVLTGSDASFRYQGETIWGCRGWTLNVQRDKIDKTGLGVYDREYKQTLRATTGTAIVLYSPGIASHAALFNRIFDDSAAVDEVGFVFYNAFNRSIDAACIIDSVSTPMNVGEAMASTFNFTVQGKVRGQF